METAIITSGYMPVPAALGGGVEALIEAIIQQNASNGRLQLTVFSIYHSQAVQQAKTVKNCRFIFIKPPHIVKACDRILYLIAKWLLRKQKSMSYRYILQRLYYVAKVSRCLRDQPFDRVVLENHATLFLVLKKYGNARKYAGRYYYHLHNLVSNDYGCQAIMRQSRKVLGVSRYIDRSFSQFLGKFPENRLTVLRNCVDVARFERSNHIQEAMRWRQKCKIASSDQVILFTGRLSEEKGIKELLEAFSRLSLPRARLVIVGGYFYASSMVSAYEKRLHAVARSLGNRVVFTGYVPHDQMPAVYAMADVSAIPSIWDDPAPLTIIESMASGLPIVTTDSGGITEYVTPECAVILQRDSQLVVHLSEALTALLRDPERRKRMGEASRRQALSLNQYHYYTDFVEKITEA
ncbi:MAG: glycosyltransferase family 4 protein [Sporolactobacillus sp.]